MLRGMKMSRYYFFSACSFYLCFIQPLPPPQLVLMDWVYELLPSTPHTKVWKRKFLVLKKSEIQIYDSYPVSLLYKLLLN